MRHYIEPRSREWFQLRLGRVTSTRLKTVAHGTLAAQTKLLDEMQWEVDHQDEAIDKSMEGFGYKTPASIKLGKEREDWLLANSGIVGCTTNPGWSIFTGFPHCFCLII